MSPVLTFGAPPDVVAWSVFGLGWVAAALCGVARLRRVVAWRLERHSALLLPGLVVAAAVLSAGYIAYYLKGGPRIIDATSYYLEARLFSQGSLDFEPPSFGSFRGRFLTGPGGDPTLSVIFPPGYPALLSLGFVLGAPLVIGPLLAAAITWATYALALRFFGENKVALLAASFSVLSAALRYHTADTMSHGLAALLFCLALLVASSPRRHAAALTGLLTGWLFATRPLSGVCCALVCAIVVFRASPRRLLELSLGVAPGVVLFLLYQRAVVGEWGFAQHHYYALGDGPPGCFSYGFGAERGCLHEHGDFVARYLQDGFGVWEGLRTSLHRLHWHSLDIANFEPLALVVLWALVKGRRLFGMRAIALSLSLIALAYVPFYFNGSYPGGGARLFADVLPLEHVALGWAASRLSIGPWLVPASLLGFALHASHGHRALAERDGGRPMFEPEVLARDGVQRGLVFVRTDHGFNLGFDPAANVASSIVVARERRDAHDRVLWEHLGRPPAYRYVFNHGAPNASPRVELWRPEMSPERLFQVESQWPALDLKSGWVQPSVGRACAGAGLLLRPAASGSAKLLLGLDPGAVRPRHIELGVANLGQDPVRLSLSSGTAAPRAIIGPGACSSLRLPSLDLGEPVERVWVSADGEILLDYVRVIPDSSGAR